jgi:hypothetical protein
MVEPLARQRTGRLVPAALIALVAVLACDDDSPYCRDDLLCACWDQPDCDVRCRERGCAIDCASTNRCNAACEDDCLYECSSTSTCTGQCAARCEMTCTSASDCDLACGEQCDVLCEDVSACRVTVGPDSHVACRRVSGCEVRCEGPCTLECSQGGCDLECAPDFSECEQDGERSCVAASC